MAAAQFRHQHVARKPRGFRVRTVTHPGSGHQIRMGFPPGPRRVGSGRVLEILHPRAENPKITCDVTPATAGGLAETELNKNPHELVIFGANPRKKRKARQKDGGLSLKTGRRPPQAGRRKRNPELQKAAALYRKFHGRDPQQILELQEAAEARKDYTALGDAVELWIQPPDKAQAKLNLDETGVKLASNADGTQLYLVGGNQRLDHCLKKFTDDGDKDFIDLGEALRVTYMARKAPSFEKTDWVHDFGEESNLRPRVVYDQLNHRILFAGGTYTVEAPGIID